MPDRVSFRCPGCNAKLSASARLMGRSRRCPACDHEFHVPRLFPEEAGPMLVPEDESSAIRKALK